MPARNGAREARSRLRAGRKGPGRAWAAVGASRIARTASGGIGGLHQIPTTFSSPIGTFAAGISNPATSVTNQCPTAVRLSVAPRDPERDRDRQQAPRQSNSPPSAGTRCQRGSQHRASHDFQLVNRHGRIDELDLVHINGEGHYCERRLGRDPIHTACLRCGKIAEFVSDGLEKLQQPVERDCRLQVPVSRLEIGGDCATCRGGG